MTTENRYPDLESLFHDYTALEIVTALNDMMLCQVILLRHEPETLPDTIGSYETIYAVRNFFLSKLPVS